MEKGAQNLISFPSTFASDKRRALKRVDDLMDQLKIMEEMIFTKFNTVRPDPFTLLHLARVANNMRVAFREIQHWQVQLLLGSDDPFAERVTNDEPRSETTTQAIGPAKVSFS